MTFAQYFKGLFQAIAALIKGMVVTLKAFFAKKVTQQYPENRKTLVISDRFRGELTMPHDGNNEHACTACGICQTNCPNGTITVVSKTIETEDGKKKKILDRYFYDLGMCTFCNLCVITCPFKAIKFDNIFENAVFTHSKLRMQLNQEGSKLREKKKPAVDAAAAPKPAPEKPAAEAAVKAEAAPSVEAEVKPKDEKPIDVNNVPIEGKPELNNPQESQVDDKPAASKLPDEVKPTESKNIITGDSKKNDAGKDDADTTGKNKYRI